MMAPGLTMHVLLMLLACTPEKPAGDTPAVVDSGT